MRQAPPQPYSQQQFTAGQQPFSPASNESAATMSNWSSLRREAATLETYINQRLSASSQPPAPGGAAHAHAAAGAGAGAGAGTHAGAGPAQMSPTAIAVSVDSSSAPSFLDLEAARVREVDESIARLASVVEKLASIAAASAQATQLVAASTLQAAVHELRQEHRRQAASVRAQREAAALLVRRAGAQGAGGGPASATELLLRERGALVGSHSAIDEVLGRAAETQAALSRQRSAMAAASGRLGGLAARLPVVGDLMNAIQRRRSRNDYIVAGVMASCMAFTLWYIFG